MDEVFCQSIEDIIETLREDKIYEDSDFYTGYRMAIYSSLLNIYTNVELFGFEPKHVFGEFDPNEWLRLGRGYKF
jgi:hypothetical protein